MVYRRRGRRRRASVVRWFPDTSAFSEVKGLALANTTASQYSTTRVLQGEPGQTALLAPINASAGGLGAIARQDTENVILDHIAGKVVWVLSGNSGTEGAQDADGDWLYCIRSAIWIGPYEVDEQSGSITAIGNALGTYFTDARTILDPGVTGAIVNQGSYGPDGVRVLWRRNWLVKATWSAADDLNPSAVSNEELCPPGPYVDLKPHRLMKANEALFVGIGVQCLPLVGGEGTSRLNWGHDLRVAGHNTSRRR